MNSIVCIKRVPEATEATLKIDDSGRKLIEDNLSFSINETDNYALEQALLVQEQFDGDVTLVSVGPPQADEVLRMGLAKGADRAVRITPSNLDEIDTSGTAALMAEQIRELDYNLIFTGCMASDDGSAQVGVTLAEVLGIPHVSLVVGMEVKEEGVAIVNRELEGGLQEEFEVTLPALFTIQSGINEPRYASILGIKRAGSKEIRVVEDIAAEDVKVTLQRLVFPPVGKMAEIFEGSTEEKAGQVAEVLKTKGLL